MITEKSLLIAELEKHFDPQSKVQQDAWDMLLEVGLPAKKSEAYKYTPITKTLETKLDFGNKPELSAVDIYPVEGNHIVLKDGAFDAVQSQLKDDLKIDTVEVMEGRHDPFSLLNTALNSSELVITIEKEVSPIFIYQVNSGTVSSPRVKVKVASGKEVIIYEKINPAKQTFVNAYISFHVAKNASATYTKIQNYDTQAYTHETIVADQERDSRFYTNTFSFSGGMIRNNLTINLQDENCEGYMYGLYLLDGKSHVDNNTSVDHLKPNSYSNELYKGILDEKSTGVFNGKIYVRQDAQKTNAFQSNNNILLSNEATVNTKPQLEIWADDVKCSHGCTTGQLDEDAIFYLRARGIDEKNAKGMILNAFASETLEYIKEEKIKEELLALITEKLS